jgi:hypothetical protein
MERMPRTFKAVPEPVDAPSGDVAVALGLPSQGPAAPRLVIGRREWLALPELGVMPLHAKTDTGARGSCLHAERIEVSPDESTVSFTTADHHGRVIDCVAPVARFGRVRSSTGVSRKRVFIETTALLCGGFRWRILVSLANRADMRCPLLLGRRDLAGYFLIDPLGNHLLGTRRELERMME